MIEALATWQLATVGMGLLATTAMAGWSAAERWGQTKAAEAEAITPDGEGDIVDLQPPDLRTARFGTLGELFRVWRYLDKRRKLANKGYVQWFLVGDTFPTGKFVKPDAKSGGMRELDHDGVTYLFPRDAMLPDENQGVLTFVHKRGDAEPLNLRDPAHESIPADVLDEYLSMRVSASAPSLLDQFDMNPKDLIKYAIGGIILLAIGKGVLEGGLA
jgi:hypothetical protein